MKAYKNDKTNKWLEKHYVQAKSNFIHSKFCIAVGICVLYIPRSNFNLEKYIMKPWKCCFQLIIIGPKVIRAIYNEKRFDHYMLTAIRINLNNHKFR